MDPAKSSVSLRSPDSTTSGPPLVKEIFPPSAKMRRATIACTRCRRHRSKCKHDGARPPCVSCREAGPAVAETCRFVGRGGKELTKLPEQSTLSPSIHQQSTTPPAQHIQVKDQPPDPEVQKLDEIKTLWGLLPPHEEVVEACKVFLNCYFQLGFLPKQLFLDRLEKDRESISVFLLLCILCVSARFTPSLVARYGGHSKAMKTFVQRAEDLASTEIYNPTLETIQGFILLGTAEWANGKENKSLIHLGVASTMCGMLRLHREETHCRPADAKPEDIINAEMGRRTLWVMGMQRNLFSDGRSPVPFSLTDITALLPCEENDFVFGLIPKARAALTGSQAAIDRPELVNSPSRSLFATLIQAHNLWGRVARRACLDTNKLKRTTLNLWDDCSEYSHLSAALNQWEAGLPKSHRWSEWYLRTYRAENLDLAYFSIFMALRLSNIVLRRTHFEDMKALILNSDTPPPFWESMAHEMFQNVNSLYEGIGAYLSQRPPAEGFPPILAFCVYNCGFLSSLLWEYPRLCPRFAHQAELVFHWSLKVLVELRDAWPLANSWRMKLQEASVGLTSLGPMEPKPQSMVPPPLNTVYDPVSSNHTQYVPMMSQPQQTFAETELSMSGEPLNSMLPTQNYSNPLNTHAYLNSDNMPLGSFQEELASYLQGDVQFRMSDEWTVRSMDFKPQN